MRCDRTQDKRASLSWPRSGARLFALLLLFGVPDRVLAAPPPAKWKPAWSAGDYLDPLYYRDATFGALRSLRGREFVQMFSAIVSGSRMGPGDGWFHPGQQRYNWKWLAARYDRNRDGRITPDEFKGPRDLFRRLDRDRSGQVTADDLDWTDRSPFVRMTSMASGWTYRIDGNSNGRISRDEWEEFFKRAARGKDHLTPEDLRDALLMPPPRPRNAPRDTGPTMGVLLPGLFNGELGSFFEGPDVGDRAPNFTLTTQDGKETIELKKYRGKKPVVLIFGSFT